MNFHSKGHFCSASRRTFLFQSQKITGCANQWEIALWRGTKGEDKQILSIQHSDYFPDFYYFYIPLLKQQFKLIDFIKTFLHQAKNINFTVT